jgi:hypothetical protein
MSDWRQLALRKFGSMNRASFLFLVGSTMFLDLIVGFSPTDVVLAGLVWIRPSRWFSTALAAATGSALAAWTLAAFFAGWGEPLAPPGAPTPDWVEIIADHGALGLSLLAMTPLPQQPAVVLSALAGSSAFDVALAVLVGRLVKHSVVAWLASRVALSPLLHVSKGYAQGTSIAGTR